MDTKLYLRKLSRWIAALAVIGLLTACALGRDVVRHSFSFDVSQDNQDAEVIDFQYGNSKSPVRASEQALRDRQTYQANGVSGPMLRGEFLYVKWRIKSTGIVYEEKVDLRHRLPRNITDHRVYFMVRGSQLYVYLVSPEKRPPDMPSIGPSLYQSRKVFQIYPDQNPTLANEAV